MTIDKYTIGLRYLRVEFSIFCTTASGLLALIAAFVVIQRENWLSTFSGGFAESSEQEPDQEDAQRANDDGHEAVEWTTHPDVGIV